MRPTTEIYLIFQINEYNSNEYMFIMILFLE